MICMHFLLNYYSVIVSFALIYLEQDECDHCTDENANHLLFFLKIRILYPD